MDPAALVRALLNCNPDVIGREVVYCNYYDSSSVLSCNTTIIENTLLQIEKIKKSIERYQGENNHKQTLKRKMETTDSMDLSVEDLDFHKEEEKANEINSNDNNNKQQALSKEKFTSPLPIDVLQILCQSDLLSIKELGRLVLFVSKSFEINLGTEFFWKTLCQRQWKNTACLPKPITNQGYERIFRQRFKSIANKIMHIDNVLPPCHLYPENMALLINIWDNDGSEVVSTILQQSELSKLLQHGELTIQLNDPIQIGQGEIGDDENIKFVPKFQNWKSRLDLFRWKTNTSLHGTKKKFDNPDNNDETFDCQCCCVHETMNRNWGEYDYFVDPNITAMEGNNNDHGSTNNTLNSNSNDNLKQTNNAQDIPLEVDMGYLDFTTNMTLQLSQVGKGLEYRIRNHDDTSEHRYDGLKIEPTLICFTQGFEEASIKKPFTKVSLEFKELRLEVWKLNQNGAGITYDSNNEANIHGVTLLHLLDHLSGWT